MLGIDVGKSTWIYLFWENDAGPALEISCTDDFKVEAEAMFFAE
jgi:hypothetical protein